LFNDQLAPGQEFTPGYHLGPKAGSARHLENVVLLALFSCTPCSRKMKAPLTNKWHRRILGVWSQTPSKVARDMARHAEAKLIAELISAPTVCYFADERR
jgi:hypothetical protein